jgi:hypothetical protein
MNENQKRKNLFLIVWRNDVDSLSLEVTLEDKIKLHKNSFSSPCFPSPLKAREVLETNHSAQDEMWTRKYTGTGWIICPKKFTRDQRAETCLLRHTTKGHII